MSTEEIAQIVNSRWEAKKKADEAKALASNKRKVPTPPAKWTKELLTNIMDEAGLPRGSKKKMAAHLMIVPILPSYDDDDDDDGD